MPVSNRIWTPNAIPSMFSEHVEPEPQLSPARKRESRSHKFDESMMKRFQRTLKAITETGARMPLASCFRVIDAVLRDKTVGAHSLLDPQHALAEPDGFCTLLSDDSAVSLINVYERGGFLDSGVTSASCWAPSQRRVVDLRTLPEADKTTLLKDGVSFDADFDAALALCNTARKIGHSPRLMHGFCTLYDAGMAHSIEIRDKKGVAVACIIGVAVGAVFVVQGEYTKNAGAAYRLYKLLYSTLEERGFILVDMTPLREIELSRSENISRAAFSQFVIEHLAHGGLGRWRAKRPDGFDLPLAA